MFDTPGSLAFKTPSIGGGGGGGGGLSLKHLAAESV